MELMTLGEVGKVLKVTKPTLYKLNRRGAFPFVKIAGTTRVEKAALLQYLRRMGVTAGL